MIEKSRIDKNFLFGDHTLGDSQIISPSVEPEPSPTTNKHPFMWDYAIEEFIKVAKARDEFGLKKYGTRLQPFNGRDALVDGFQENVDAIVYGFQKLYEEQFTKPVVYAAVDFVASLTADSESADEALKNLVRAVRNLKEANPSI